MFGRRSSGVERSLGAYPFWVRLQCRLEGQECSDLIDDMPSFMKIRKYEMTEGKRLAFCTVFNDQSFAVCLSLSSSRAIKLRLSSL